MLDMSVNRLRSALHVAIFGGITLLIIGYAAFQARGIVLGPAITLNDRGLYASTTDAAVVTISGTIKRANAISLNDRPIFIDLSGNFSERFALSPGYNILVIKARGPDGKEVAETLKIYRTTSPPLADATTSQSYP